MGCDNLSMFKSLLKHHHEGKNKYVNRSRILENKFIGRINRAKQYIYKISLEIFMKETLKYI
jgi:hypothetical protein